MTNEVHAARLTAQLLGGPPAPSVQAVVEQLLAVQAQDPRGFRLAVRARSTALHAREVDAALDERSLVVTTLNRGTLHLVRSEDHAWLHALTTPPLHTTSRRRLQQEGVAPEVAERGVAAVERALRDGPQRRDALREVLLRAGVPAAGQAVPHVLLLAALRGLLVRGPVLEGEQAYVLVREWLGPPEEVERDEALGRLARRYLAGHGPASDRDLARWSGLGLRDVRRGLAQVPGLVERADGLVDLPGRAVAPLPPPRLLGAFDPVLLGWTSRTDVTGPHTALVTDNGVFRPFAMVDGRAVATWSYARGRVALRPLEPFDEQALDGEVAAVERFLSG